MKIQQEIVPIGADDMFIIMNHPNAKFDYGLHYHPEYEINLVLRTSGTRVVGDSKETFGDYDLVLIGSNVPHVWKSEFKENQQITIQFAKDMLDFEVLSKRIYAPIRQLLLDSRSGLVFSGPSGDSIKDKIIELTRMQGFQTVTAFWTILNMMAGADRRKLVSSAYDNASLVSKSKSRRVEKVCAYIEQNIGSDISLSDVAGLVNMSESAFSHFFKKRTGITFINYLNNMRISRACNLLADTTLSAAEICYDCGFNNLSNFIRIFSKKKGKTPIEYRKYISQLLTKY